MASGEREVFRDLPVSIAHEHHDVQQMKDLCHEKYVTVSSMLDESTWYFCTMRARRVQPRTYYMKRRSLNQVVSLEPFEECRIAVVTDIVDTESNIPPLFSYILSYRTVKGLI